MDQDRKTGGSERDMGKKMSFIQESAWRFLPDESQEFRRYEQLLGFACGDASLLDGDAPEKTIKVEMNRA